jgi:hypothetical protein
MTRRLLKMRLCLDLAAVYLTSPIKRSRERNVR